MKRKEFFDRIGLGPESRSRAEVAAIASALAIVSSGVAVGFLQNSEPTASSSNETHAIISIRN